MALALHDDRNPMDDDYVEQQEDDVESDPDDLTSKQEELIAKLRMGEVNLDSDKNDEVSKFKATYSSCLIGGEEGTVIHMVLRRWRKDRNLDAFKSFFRWSIEANPNLLFERNDQGETILHLAIQKELSSVVEDLCICAPDEETRKKAISCRGRHMGNCVHAAIRMKLEVAMYLVDVCEYSNLEDQDEFGDTVLHLAVNCGRRDLKYNEELVAKLIERCPNAAYVRNASGETPYGYHIATAMAELRDEKNFVRTSIRPALKLKKRMVVKSDQSYSNRIKRIFMLLYMRNCSKEDCLELIYGQSKTEGKLGSLANYRDLL
jgi:hypothetical protein